MELNARKQFAINKLVEVKKQLYTIEQDRDQVWIGLQQTKKNIMFEMKNQIRNFEEAIYCVEMGLTKLSETIMYEYEKHKN